MTGTTIYNLGTANISSAFTNKSLKSPKFQSESRQEFWKQILKHHNFNSKKTEQQLILQLAQGKFRWQQNLVNLDKHVHIYSQVSTPIYERSERIERDVNRTFSIFHSHFSSTFSDEEESNNMCLKKHTLNKQRPLYKILNAVAEVENGYCQGMNFIAAVLLVEGLSEAECFSAFLYALQQRHLSLLYKKSSRFLKDYLEHFQQMSHHYVPELSIHLNSLGFFPMMYGIEWFTTMFSCCTKLDLTCAIFDLFFIGIKDILLRVGISILQLLESELLCLNFEELLHVFKDKVRQLDTFSVILNVLKLDQTWNSLIQTKDTLDILHDQIVYSELNELSELPVKYHRHRTLNPQLHVVIKQGSFVDFQKIWSDQNPPFNKFIGNEILHHATWYGRADIAEFVIQQSDLDVNATDDNGLSCLDFCVVRNQPHVARIILSYSLVQNKHLKKLVRLASYFKSLNMEMNAILLILSKKICLYCNVNFNRVEKKWHQKTMQKRCFACGFSFCNLSRTCFENHLCNKIQSSCVKMNVSDVFLGKNVKIEFNTLDEDQPISSIASTGTDSYVSIEENCGGSVNPAIGNMNPDEESENEVHGNLLWKRLFAKIKFFSTEDNLTHHDDPFTWCCSKNDCHIVFSVEDSLFNTSINDRMNSSKRKCEGCQLCYCQGHYWESIEKGDKLIFYCLYCSSDFPHLR